jgi:excisionase family DNA binding protein
MIGELERVKSILWIRMTAPPAPPRVNDPLEELRHLTPSQVAELLNLTEAYVHEMCRSRRLPAVKQGKYWIIPVGGLRAWLGQAGSQLDRSGSGERSSEDATPAPTPRPGAARHTRAPTGDRVRDVAVLADLHQATAPRQRQRRPTEQARRASSGDSTRRTLSEDTTGR